MSSSVDPRRLARIDSVDLGRGQHAGLTQGACLMEAAAYLAGEPWSDAPRCASPVIGGLLRTWNDLLPRRPRQELKRHLPRLVGSRGTPAQETQRAALAVAWFFHGPGQALPAGQRGKQIVGTAIETARLHAPDAQPLDGQLVPPDPPRRVPRHVLDAVHDLIDQLLAVTETVPAPSTAPTSTPQAAPALPADEPRPAPPAAPETAPSRAAAAPSPARPVAPDTAPQPAPDPIRAPGPQRAPRPRRPARRAPARRGGLPPTLPPVLPPIVQRTDT